MKDKDILPFHFGIGHKLDFRTFEAKAFLISAIRN